MTYNPGDIIKLTARAKIKWLVFSVRDERPFAIRAVRCDDPIGKILLQWVANGRLKSDQPNRQQVKNVCKFFTADTLCNAVKISSANYSSK
jgi:hypothetical protein